MLEMLLEGLSQKCGKMKRYWLLRINDILKLIQRFLDYCLDENGEKIKPIIAEDSIKRALSVRYLYIIFEDNVSVRSSNEIISKALKYLNVRKSLYKALFYFPNLYRAFCIHGDSFMLNYERQLKVASLNEVAVIYEIRDQNQ